MFKPCSWNACEIPYEFVKYVGPDVFNVLITKGIVLFIMYLLIYYNSYFCLFVSYVYIIFIYVPIFVLIFVIVYFLSLLYFLNDSISSGLNTHV